MRFAGRTSWAPSRAVSSRSPDLVPPPWYSALATSRRCTGLPCHRGPAPSRSRPRGAADSALICRSRSLSSAHASFLAWAVPARVTSTRAMVAVARTRVIPARTSVAVAVMSASGKSTVIRYLRRRSRTRDPATLRPEPDGTGSSSAHLSVGPAPRTAAGYARSLLVAVE